MSMPAPPRPTPGRSARRLETLRGPRRTTPGLRRTTQKSVPRCTNTNCSSGDVVEDEGKLICRSCGFVVSDAQITQELTFGEAANGAAVVQGVYVGAGEENARNPGLGPSKLTGGMDSRQVTERNGQQAISNLVAALQLSTTQKDRAFRLYKLAMLHNFIQGRKTNEVAAVCLYIACRQDAECRIMLVDFSDLLKRNVFDLGKVYNAFIEELNVNGSVLNLQQVNPENLIQRFAQDLEFGPDEHRIANEAVQILKRLDRDWITPGRRPAGVCAAAIILAARMNNYRRTVREVVYTAKVCDITIHKRLDEFRYTDSSKLTVEEFRNHAETLSKLHDPPSFYRQFEPKKKKRKINHAAAADDENEDETVVQTVPETIPGPSIETAGAGLSSTSAELPIDPALYGEVSEEHLSALAHAEHADVDDSAESDINADQAPSTRKRGRPKGAKNKPLPILPEADVNEQIQMEEEVERVLQNPNSEAQAAEAHRTLGSESGGETAQGSTNQQSTRTEPTAQPRRISREVRDTEYISESEFADDPDVANALLTAEEKAIKEQIWVTENGEYLRLQQARKLKHELAVTAGTARVPKKRTRRLHRMGDVTPYRTIDEHGRASVPSSPAESAKQMLSHRGYSKRLDYSKIDLLFGRRKSTPSSNMESPSNATSVRAESEASDAAATSPPTVPSEDSKRSESKAGSIPRNTRVSRSKEKAVEPIVIEDGDDDESEEESAEEDDVE